MPMLCFSCVKMDVEEGQIEQEFDFAEDALEFETQLAETREVTFTQTLTEPLSIGSLIVFTGTPDEDVPWFALNIGSGDVDSGKADIAVHFNVRMPQRYVVRNTRRNTKWGDEETTSFRKFPFKIDREFSIEVLLEENSTMFAVDGKHYCGYGHRTPAPFTAAWVQVTGIKDASLVVKKTDFYPTLAAELCEVPIRECKDALPLKEEPKWEPNIMAKLSNGIPEGCQLVIRGRLRPYLHSFIVDLTDGVYEWPHANVHVHVNVRAHVSGSAPRQLVVLNAWLGGWGAERRQRATLVPASEITFRLVRGAGEWGVYFDDVMIGELEYRAAADAVKSIRIRGDLYPEEMYVCPSTSSPVTENC